MGCERAVWLVAMLGVGCFRPAPEAGAPCADNGRCPAGLECIGNRCEVPGTPFDDAALDADVDADMRDAPIDGAMLWSMPQPIPGVNTTGAETDPSLSGDLLTIVFARANDLYLGTRMTTAMPFTVVPLAALNTPNRDQSPELSTDGNTLWFTSEVVAVGDADVYVSIRGTGGFTTKTRVDELSAAGVADGDLAISPDGLTAIVGRGTFFRATRPTPASVWSVPATLGAIFGTSPASPALTAGGDLYFHADATRNLYVSRKSGATFGTPAPITELNTATRDAAPFISANERRLWFERDGELYESMQ